MERAYLAPKTAERMRTAAQAFLDALDTPRRDAARFDFDDQERFRWNYRPDGIAWQGQTFWHEGLRLVNMTPDQQRAAHALLETGLSAHGQKRVESVMALEHDLRLQERTATRFVEHVTRDPELYSFAIFGSPGDRRWSWRAGGHHLCLHFTVIDQHHVAPTPLFLGANPALVRHGANVGKRVLAGEEDQARTLLQSLGPDARRIAIVRPEAPHDILTDVFRRPNRDALPHGLAFHSMPADAREHLVRLIRLYVDRTTDEVATASWKKIEAAGLDLVSFAWAGAEEPGKAHYYAVRGPSFIIEYDNTQDDANHIHSVLRDFDSDWGEDLLAEHYRHGHHHHST